MNKEEFFNRMINRICKDYGYDVASTFELLYMTKEKELEEKDKEIDRLNNITNGLEKWLEQQIMMAFKSEVGYYIECANKLKELKEGNK